MFWEGRLDCNDWIVNWCFVGAQTTEVQRSPGYRRVHEAEESVRTHYMGLHVAAGNTTMMIVRAVSSTPVLIRWQALFQRCAGEGALLAQRV